MFLSRSLASLLSRFFTLIRENHGPPLLHNTNMGTSNNSIFHWYLLREYDGQTLINGRYAQEAGFNVWFYLFGHQHPVLVTLWRQLREPTHIVGEVCEGDPCADPCQTNASQQCLAHGLYWMTEDMLNPRSNP